MNCLRSSVNVSRLLFPSFSPFCSVRLYSKEHEWVELDEKNMEGRVGITRYAKQQLGDVVYIDFPQVGDSFSEGDSAGQLESVKTVGELYMPF